jgi:hypothetical protein
MNSFRQLPGFSWSLALAGLTLIAPLALGQNQDSAPTPVSSENPCPTISVSCPNDHTPGELLIYTAASRGGDPKAILTYHWTTSAGTIVEGQGTPMIKVRVEGWSTHTATLKVGGLHPSCATTASCSLPIHKPLPPLTKFDSYGTLPIKKERPRLEKFATALKNQPGAQGYVLSYGRRGFPADAIAAGERAKAYLVNDLGIDSGRIVTVEGGFREKPTIDLWVVTSGRTPPTPEPTINPSDLKPKKRPAKKIAKHPGGH